MGTKVNVDELTTLATLTAVSKVNDNFGAVSDEFDKVLYSDGSNTLRGSFDANSNRIINLPDALSGGEPVTKRQLPSLAALALAAFNGTSTNADVIDRFTYAATFGVRPGIDCTTQLQAAINFAVARGIGGTVLLPAGQLTCGPVVINAGNVAIRGVSKRSTFVTNIVPNTTLFTVQGSGRIYGNCVADMTLMQNGAATSGAALFLVDCGQVTVENVNVLGYSGSSPNYGIVAQRCTQITLTGTETQGCTSHGTYVQDSNDVVMNYTRSDANGACGYYLSTNGGVYASLCTGYNNGNICWLIDDATTAVISGGNIFHFYNSCIGDTSGNHNWQVSNLKNSSWLSCWGSDTSGSTLNASGMILSNVTNFDLIAFRAILNNGHGLQVINGSSGKINGGSFMCNGQATAGLAGIVLDSDNIIVDNVTCIDDRTPKTQAFGIVSSTNFKNGSITNSVLTGNAYAPEALQASAFVDFYEAGNKTGLSPIVASASTITLPTLGSIFTVSGSTTINTINVAYPNRKVLLAFSGAPTVTTAGNLKIGSSMSASANSTLSLLGNGTNFLQVSRSIN